MINNKSRYGILLAALMLGVTSCQDDELVSEVATGGSDRHLVTITGVIDDDTQERATALSGSFHWNEGDCFSLYRQSGTEVPDTAFTLYISDSYSNDSVSSSATFSGECDFEGYSYMRGIYPAQTSAESVDTLTFTIAQTTAMGTNSDEEIQAYMSANMYMYTSRTYSSYNNGTLSFSHLTCMAKIVYTNETETAQTIDNVSLSADGEYFGTERYFTLTGGNYGTLSTVSEIGLTFDGATVAAGESMDFYIFFFPSSSDSYYSYIGSSASLTVTVNDESVTMSSYHLSSYLYSGRYYTFNVSQSDDGLSWTNYVTLLKSDNTALVDALYSALGTSDSYKDSEGNLLVKRSAIENTTSLSMNSKSLTSLTGLELFVNLETLYIRSNSLTSVDLSSFPKLAYLDCQSNYLTSLDISNNPLLATLYCQANDQLTSLDFSGHTGLVYLNCYDCDGLTSLDVSGCTSLETLKSDWCDTLESINATNCTALTEVDNDNCPSLTSLIVDNCSALADLDCQYCTALPSLDLSTCTALVTLDAYRCSSMETLNLNNCSSLEEANCYRNKLTTLTVAGCTSMTLLYCAYNYLTELDLADCTALVTLYTDVNSLESLDLTANTKLETAHCFENNIPALDLSNNVTLTTLMCMSNKLSSLDITKTQMSSFYCGGQTDDDGNAITLTVLMTESQQVLWENSWSSYSKSYSDINGNTVNTYNSKNVEVTVESSSSDTDDTAS